MEFLLDLRNNYCEANFSPPGKAGQAAIATANCTIQVVRKTRFAGALVWLEGVEVGYNQSQIEEAAGIDGKF
jgi:hypothetical protein